MQHFLRSDVGAVPSPVHLQIDGHLEVRMLVHPLCFLSEFLGEVFVHDAMVTLLHVLHVRGDDLIGLLDVELVGDRCHGTVVGQGALVADADESFEHGLGSVYLGLHVRISKVQELFHVAQGYTSVDGCIFNPADQAAQPKPCCIPRKTGQTR